MLKINRKLAPLLLINFTLIYPSSDANQSLVLSDIYVDGIKASLQKSLERKKNSSTILDAVSSEDVTKFPDRNIAESLTRLTGITVSRDYGEGVNTTIRGLGKGLNITQLNGQALGTAQWFILNDPKRDFNYEMLSSELVSHVEVYKGSQANLDEGALGATVQLHTRKPLELNAHTFETSFDMHYGSTSDMFNPSGSFLYSWKNSTNTFGILIAASRQDREVYKTGFGSTSYNNPSTTPSMQAPNGSTEKGTTSFLMGSALFQQKRERIGTDIMLQWVPEENLITTFHYFNSKLNASNKTQNFLSFASKNLKGSQPLNGTVQDGIVTQLEVPASDVLYQNIFRDGSKINTEMISAKAEYIQDTYSITTHAGKSIGTGFTNDYIFDFKTSPNIQNENFIYHNNNSTPYMDYTTNSWVANPTNQMYLSGATHVQGNTSDKEDFAQLDYEQQFTNSPFTSLQLGLKYRDRSFQQKRYRSAARENSNAHLGDAGIYSDGTFSVNNIEFYDVDDKSLIADFLSLPLCTDVQDGTLCRTPSVFLQRASFFIEEQILALYAMANFETNNFYGNIGMRYITTKTKSEDYNILIDNSNTNSNKGKYSQLLPSFNLNYKGFNNQLLRLSISKVMARPSPYQLSAAMTLRPEIKTATTGNSKLQPLSATQFDFSYEWYYAQNSLLNLSLFHKKIKNFVVNQDITASVNGELYTITKPFNSSSSTLSGVELSLQHYLTNNIGFISNYTYIHTPKIKVGSTQIQFPNTSKHTANFSIFYENEKVSSRLSYNYRSKFFKRISGGGTFWGNKQSYLDTQLSYNINKNWSIKLEGLNLTNERLKNHYITPKNKKIFADEYENGRRFYLGVKYKF